MCIIMRGKRAQSSALLDFRESFLALPEKSLGIPVVGKVKNVLIYNMLLSYAMEIT